MNEDLNSSQPVKPDAGNPFARDAENTLARALQELIAEPDSHSGALLAEAGACPEPGEWLRMVNGEASIAEADALLTHAAACGACAARLRLGIQTFAENPSREESAELGQLASTSAPWQRNLAGRLAHTPVKAAQKRVSMHLLWAGAGLAATVVLTAGLTMWWHRQNSPEKLLAEAYTHSRIFDLRMAGAGYAEVKPAQHLRGDATGREPAGLLDARARIERQLERTPNDPHWLQLEARADLLEEKYDSAIDILDRLVAAGPVNANLLLDDASAYFQRGTATDSENDRATALDDLRHADELAPDDPVVLFNEALVMEDRGQVMNAVETWNRYLSFERDPQWLAEGRGRLKSLEDKLNRLKSHQSRMLQHLASPPAMRALAADPATLADLDEELSTTLLPRLLRSAFPLPVDRSRGSPCDSKCQAARALLHALAASLERNHQDPWLTQLLPSDSSPPTQNFVEAGHALAQAIDADGVGDYAAARQWALKGSLLFHILGNAAGEDRAEVERVYALQRLSQMASCYQAAHALLDRDPRFAWIYTHDLTEEGICDTGPGSATEDIPSFARAGSLAREHHYVLLEMRVRNMTGGTAIESGDTEDAWRIYLATIRRLYTGDFPPFRTYTTMAGLAEVEKSTPRVHLALLLQREVMGLLQLSQSPGLIPSQRFDLAIAAIRAGFIPEAQKELRKVQEELAGNDAEKSTQGFLADSEIAMANLYLTRGDLDSASTTLDAAHAHMANVDDFYEQRAYAAARGQLELALGHPDAAEPMLRDAVVNEERQARSVGPDNIIVAQQNRDLYAVLAGVWLEQGRSGQDILALWERYRLRILGKPVPVCPDKGLTCLKPQLTAALGHLGNDQLLGQVVLLDRALLFHANAQGVVWTTATVGRERLLAAAARLERAVSSPATSQNSVDAAARRVGGLLLTNLHASSATSGQLWLEPDPLLGNLPWSAAETADGPIGLRFDIEEEPSLLLAAERNAARFAAPSTAGNGPLVVGASFASGSSTLLPEVLNEARAVARFAPNSSLLLGGKATEARVVARIETAPVIHFAGHTTQQDGSTRLLLAPARTGSTEGGADMTFIDSDLLRKYPPRAARLAVFSACSTGKREEGWNHGMGDIVDTLASLGVPQVVATRWQIDSASAVPMMDAFYGGLARGLTVPQALTAARQSLIRDARFRHPYYWAAYYASGWGKPDMRAVFQGSGK